MPNLLIAVLILGACGLFLALPGGRANRARFGLLGLAAAGGLLVAWLVRWLAPAENAAFAAGGGLVALLAAVRVITHQKPVYSALYFVLLIVAVAALLLQMEAEFLAAALVIVYAGAILVTYIFVIMLAQQSRAAPYDLRSREPFWGCLAGFVLLAVVGGKLFGASAGEPVPARAPGTIEAVGTPLLTHYVVAIQIVGVVLLAAMVGAIAIARRRATVSDASEGES